MAKAVQRLVSRMAAGFRPTVSHPAEPEPAMLRLPQYEPVQDLSQQALSAQHMEQRLLQRELEIARKIQESLLPKSFPELPGFDLAGFCRSARQVGGDFFDAIPLPGPAVLLVVADVMGKGVPAALFAATLRTLLRTMVQWTERPGDLLARINRMMFQELSSVDMFITAQLALLDIAQKSLTVANAGHCPLLIGDEKGVEAVAPEGMPLGIVLESMYSETVVPLAPSTSALLYTDGLSEARNQRGDSFGQRSIEQWLLKTAKSASSADQLKQDMLATLRAFEAGSTAADDQTFLLLRAVAQPPDASASKVELPVSETANGSAGFVPELCPLSVPPPAAVEGAPLDGALPGESVAP